VTPPARLHRALWLLAAPAFALLHCGGRAELDSGTAQTADGGAAVDAMADDGRSTDDTCAGAGGARERPLEPYARLRTACHGSATINRGGAPVPIDPHIK
jgi:hypothetical protein